MEVPCLFLLVLWLCNSHHFYRTHSNCLLLCYCDKDALMHQKYTQTLIVNLRQNTCLWMDCFLQKLFPWKTKDFMFVIGNSFSICMYNTHTIYLLLPLITSVSDCSVYWLNISSCFEAFRVTLTAYSYVNSNVLFMKSGIIMLWMFLWVLFLCVLLPESSVGNKINVCTEGGWP